MTSHVTFKQGVRWNWTIIWNSGGFTTLQYYRNTIIMFACVCWCSTIYYMCACGYWNTDFCHCSYNIDCQFTFLPTFNDVGT